MVNVQISDLHRALHNHSIYLAISPFAHFVTPHSASQTKLPAETKAHFAVSLVFKPRTQKPKTVMSVNTVLTKDRQEVSSTAKWATDALK